MEFNKTLLTPTRIILIAILTIILLFTFTGEKVARFEQAGWDGREYREMAQTFSEKIKGDSYNTYKIQRILPFALINTTFNIFGWDKNNANIMTAMIILCIFAVIVSLIYFFKTSNALELNSTLEIIAFSGIFYNYSILKCLGYYPFQTDIFAFMLSIMIFYFFIKRKKWLIVLSGIIGAFIWPTLLITALALAFFSTNASPLICTTPLNRNSNVLLILFKAGAMLLVPALCLYLYFRHGDLKTLYSFKATTYGHIYILMLSLIALSIYIYRMIKIFHFDIIYTIKDFFRQTGLSNLILFIVIYSSVYIITHLLAKEDSNFDLKALFVQTSLRAIAKPIVFLEAHFIYFGPIVLLTIFLWKSYILYITKYGYGFMFITFSLIILSLNSESRYMITLLPFVSFPICLILEKYNLKKSAGWLFAFASIIISRFWFTINTPDIEQEFIAENFLEFPAQRYFMNSGSWQNWTTYSIFMTTTVICAFLIWYGYRHKWYTDSQKKVAPY